IVRGINFAAMFVRKNVIQAILVQNVRTSVMFLAITQNVSSSVASLAQCVQNGVIGHVSMKENAIFHVVYRVRDYHVISIVRGLLSADTNGNFGICGEVCPSSKFCVECAPENVKNQVVDLIMQSTFAETDWKTELMVVLDCGHVFTAETLDAFLEMKEFYHCDNQGNWVGIKPIVDKPGSLKCCPNC
ncbi:2393_t:CDS:2, partial [Acaulospora morrowiae]